MFKNAGRTELTDIVTPMYPSVQDLVELGDDSEDNRPIVLCEYQHAMGNSNGNLHLYFDKFWGSNKRIQGMYHNLFPWSERCIFISNFDVYMCTFCKVVSYGI